MTIYNFSAGPAMLPQAVKEQVQKELLDWHGTGVSMLEMGHRAPEFTEVANQAEQDLRYLLAIPENYSVLFLAGGATVQFATLVLNLLGDKETADYFNTGTWSEKALNEAKKYCEVNVVATAENGAIQDKSSWHLNPEAAYVYYADNETIAGIEFPEIPNVGNVPLVSDMTSNLLSRQFDISKFGMVFAGAQKNIGPAGLTVVIVRHDLLDRVNAKIPSVFDYRLQTQERSFYNTPPTFAIYVSALVFKWLKAQGGVPAMEEINQRKASMLYEFIDGNDFYTNNVQAKYRSRMNVPFMLKDESLQQMFLQQASAEGMLNLKGHRLSGGCRASIYNAMPEAGVEKLIDFMQRFCAR